MKSTILSLILFLGLTRCLLSQTEVKTYYDIYNTKLKELYHTNNIGEKNGSYKAYYEDGLIGVECSYSNGLLNGTYKEYQWGGSKTYLLKEETYSKGMLQGQAKYFGGENLSIVIRSGNYVDGKEDGVWTFIEEVASGSYFPKGYQYYKSTATYQNGKVVSLGSKGEYYPAGGTYFIKTFNEAKLQKVETFFPSGTIAKITNYEDGERISSEVEYFENGDTVALTITQYSESENQITYTEWHPNGKIKISKKTVNSIEVHYEGYNEDGSPDDKMKIIERNKINEQGALEKQKQEVLLQRQICNEKKTIADEFYTQGNYSSAKLKYDELILTVKQYNNQNVAAKDTSNYQYLNEIYKHCNQRLTAIENYDKQIEQKKTQDSEIKTKHEQFISLYFKREAVTGTSGLTTEPVYKNTYPCGKHIYEKSEEYFNLLVQSRNLETDLTKQIELGNEILKLLDKMIALSKTDTSEIDKKLKKVVSPAEIKEILGL